MLNLAVCVKAVPKPELADQLKIDPATKSLPRLNIPLALNPVDRNAMEAALEVGRKYGAEITVFSMGPPSAEEVVRECLALGADKGILLSDRDFAGADAYATALTLAKAIEKNGRADVVLCGMASSDGATEWVGAEIAALMDLPVVTRVRRIVQDQGDVWTVEADYEKGYRTVRVKLPAVLTITRALNRPKPLSFSGIVKARSKEITLWGRQDLGLPQDCTGLAGSPTYVTSMSTLDRQRHAEFVEGCLQEKVDRLIRILAESGAIQ